jgi:hypothetical protein
VKNTRIIEREIEAMQKTLLENKSKIQMYFDKNPDVNIITVTSRNLEKGSKVIEAKKVERVYIDYDIPALQKKLDKDVFDKIANKQFVVNDMDGLIELLKESGIKPKEFKPFIQVLLTPNKEALKQAYEVGTITKTDLDGCYTAKLVKSVQIKEKKVDDN